MVDGPGAPCGRPTPGRACRSRPDAGHDKKNGRAVQASPIRGARRSRSAQAAVRVEAAEPEVPEEREQDHPEADHQDDGGRPTAPAPLVAKMQVDLSLIHI